LAQPVYGSCRPVEKGIDRGDVVGGVVEMDEVPAFHYRRTDVSFGPSRVPSLRFQDGTRARDNATAIFRMLAQVALRQIRGFLVPAEVSECPRDLVVPQRRIGFGRRFSDLT